MWWIECRWAVNQGRVHEKVGAEVRQLAGCVHGHEKLITFSEPQHPHSQSKGSQCLFHKTLEKNQLTCDYVIVKPNSAWYPLILTHIYILNLKNWYKWTYVKAEIETKMQRTNVWRVRQIGRLGLGYIQIYIKLCIKQITNENLLDSTGNSTQCSVVT